jgi:hypothetical protein
MRGPRAKRSAQSSFFSQRKEFLMRLNLDLAGPNFEIGLSGSQVRFKSHGNVVGFDLSQLDVVIKQLRLIGKMVGVAGTGEAGEDEAEAAPIVATPAAPKAAPAPAVAEAPAAPAPAPMVESAPEPEPAPRSPRLSRRRRPTAPAAPAAAPAAPPAEEKAAGPRPTVRRRRSRRAAEAAPAAPAPRLHDHLHAFLEKNGPASVDDLVAYAKRRKLSDASNFKLAVTIALGRERQRFVKLADGRWDVPRAD